ARGGPIYDPATRELAGNVARFSDAPRFADGWFRIDRALVPGLTLTTTAIVADDGYELFRDRAERVEDRVADHTRFARVTATLRQVKGKSDNRFAISVMPFEHVFERGALQHDRAQNLALDGRGEVQRKLGAVAGLVDVKVRAGAELHVTRHDLAIA